MNKFVKTLACQVRPLFKRSAIFLVLAIFALNDAVGQVTRDSTKVRGIQFGAMFHGSVGSSIEYYASFSKSRSFWNFYGTAGIQYTRTASGRHRFMLTPLRIYHNLLELDNGAFTGLGVGSIFVLAEANALDLVRDTDKFIDNANYIIPMEVYVGYKEFIIGYQYNLMLDQRPFVEYPTHAIVFYYRLKLR